VEGSLAALRCDHFSLPATQCAERVFLSERDGDVSIGLLTHTDWVQTVISSSIIDMTFFPSS
jgi:hypothetical protein